MKIVFISPMSLPSVGGLQYVVHYWAVALSEAGHQIILLTETPEGLSEDSRQPYTIIRKASGYRQWQVMRQADKVLMFNVSLKALPLWFLSGRPLYVSHQTALWYEDGIHPYQQVLKQWVANIMVKDQAACSTYIGNLYRSCKVIYNPIRQDIFKNGNKSREKNSVFFAGRFVSDKGIDLLIDAVAMLIVRGKSMMVTIMGDGSDKKILQEQVRFKGLQKAIRFVGFLPQLQMADYMQTHQIMAVPSRMEPMGMVVAEGLACGCTMVVSNQGGMPEVGGSFCHYFESGDVESLADALQQALQEPLHIDEAALQAHLSQFTIGHSVDGLKEMMGL